MLGAGGESVPKIPTLINYASSHGGDFTWGASVDRKLDNIVGVKLLLDPKQELPLYLPTGNVKQDLRKLPKSAIDVAADFISAIYKHALTEISKEVPKDYMTICQKEFVLSGTCSTSHSLSKFCSPTHTNMQFLPSGRMAQKTPPCRLDSRALLTTLLTLTRI